jgi:hypothetical protein
MVVNISMPSNYTLPTSNYAAPNALTKKRKWDDQGLSLNQGSSTSKKPSKKAPVKLSSSNTVSSRSENWSSVKTVIPYNGPYQWDGGLFKDNRPASAPYRGVYGVSCPQIEFDWQEDTIAEFYLAFTVSGNDEWWSRFKWGNYEGILVMKPPKKVSVGYKFEWRAHKIGTDSRGEGTGLTTFTSRSAFRGEFFAFFGSAICMFEGVHKFTARKSSNSMTSSYGTPLIDRMRQEWIALQPPAYEGPRKKLRIKEEPDHPRNSVKEESPTLTYQHVKHEPTKYHRHCSSVDSFQGVFRMDCPTITDQFDAYDHILLRLSLIQDSSRGLWWATFSWPSGTCMMQMNPGPVAFDKSCSLGWRMRQHDGDMKFGRRCTGNMTLYRDGALQGTLFNTPFAATVEFWGEKIAGVSSIDKESDEFQDDWDEFVNVAYGSSPMRWIGELSREVDYDDDFS